MFATAVGGAGPGCVRAELGLGASLEPRWTLRAPISSLQRLVMTVAMGE